MGTPGYECAVTNENEFFCDLVPRSHRVWRWHRQMLTKLGRVYLGFDVIHIALRTCLVRGTYEGRIVNQEMVC